MFPALVLAHLLNHRAALVLYQVKFDAHHSQRIEEPPCGDGNLQSLLPLGITSYLNIIDIVLVIGIMTLIGIQIAAVVEFTAERSVSLPAGSGVKLQDRFISFPVSPFELMNRSNVRDIPVVHKLNIILDQLYSSKGNEVSIMSEQMGMVAYHISQRHFGRVRMLDRAGVVDRTFTDCEITSGLKKNATGLIIDYKFYFNHSKSIEHICGIERPDIIFGIFLRGVTLVRQNGYTVMYSQSGQINSGSQRAFRVDEFIAVRNDLVPALGGIEPVHLDAKSLLKSK
jgi:hypothetical protein